MRLLSEAAPIAAFRRRISRDRLGPAPKGEARRAAAKRRRASAAFSRAPPLRPRPVLARSPLRKAGCGSVCVEVGPCRSTTDGANRNRPDGPARRKRSTSCGVTCGRTSARGSFRSEGDQILFRVNETGDSGIASIFEVSMRAAQLTKNSACRCRDRGTRITSALCGRGCDT